MNCSQKNSTRILGYTDKISVCPGDAISFKVSCETVKEYSAEIVRVICADIDPSGPGLQYTSVPRGDCGLIQGRHQPISTGSYIRFLKRTPMSQATGISVGAIIWPTMPATEIQTLIGQWSPLQCLGYALQVNKAGELSFVVGDGSGASHEVSTGNALRERVWSIVGASFCNRTGRTVLWQEELHSATPTIVEANIDCRICSLELPPLLIAAHGGGATGSTSGHYNGKIEAPRLACQPLEVDDLRALIAMSARSATKNPSIVGSWDFSQDIRSTRVHDEGFHELTGETVNLPARGVTGSSWDGSELDWRMDPEKYGAIHFHDDDLYDCGWSTDFTWFVDPNATSGFYAALLTSDGIESWICFFVRPPRTHRTAPVAVVASTATYMAYANTHIKFDSLNTERLFESALTLSQEEIYLNEHRELGYSLYDTHSDGSGVIYSSRLRPILTMRPGQYTFNYVNDTHVIAWLEALGQSYDVITDEDVHNEGLEILARYDVVMTLSHPEYVSKNMWDAFYQYQWRGGRHMCLGGNGFYWRIACHPELSGVIENRRGYTGVRTWEGEPGEEGLSFTGEPGGLWRCHGHAPQRLIGVGFSATLFNRSTWYRRTQDSFDPRVRFIFEGIGDNERIGDFGCRGGGAVGLEIDRADNHLGTPSDALVVATSEEIGYGGLLTVEEFITTSRALDGAQNGLVRADMVFFETANHGAVWATGSIAWATSLSHASYQNSVSRITNNVLQRFLDRRPFLSRD
jgi:N,N-dimethylformamidase